MRQDSGVTGRPSGGETVGARIRRLRLERGLTQRSLAGPGVSVTLVCHVEKGNRNPSMKALRVMAQRLGVSAGYLETGIEEGELEARLADAELELRLGRPEAAGEAFDEALQTATQVNDLASVERARIGLGLAAANQGQYAAAIEQLEAVLAERRPPVAERPDLYAVLGRSYSLSGEVARAVTLFRRCVEEIAASEPVDPAVYVRFATYLSYALTDIGDLTGATLTLSDALARAEEISSDPYTQVRIYWSLARLYGVKGPPDLTLSYYRRAISLLESTEDRFSLASAHESCASALLDQGNAPEAREHLEIAERIYREQGLVSYIGSAKTEWARLQLQSGDLAAAREAALEALDLLEEGATARDDAGNAWVTLGEVLMKTGEEELAERAYRTAIELLQSGAPVKYLADAYQSYADFLQSAGREKEALELLREAIRLTSRPVQREEVARD